MNYKIKNIACALTLLACQAGTSNLFAAGGAGRATKPKPTGFAGLVAQAAASAGGGSAGAASAGTLAEDLPPLVIINRADDLYTRLDALSKNKTLNADQKLNAKNTLTILSVFLATMRVYEFQKHALENAIALLPKDASHKFNEKYAATVLPEAESLLTAFLGKEDHYFTNECTPETLPSLHKKRLSL